MDIIGIKEFQKLMEILQVIFYIQKIINHLIFYMEKEF